MASRMVVSWVRCDVQIFEERSFCIWLSMARAAECTIASVCTSLLRTNPAMPIIPIGCPCALKTGAAEAVSA